MTDKDREVLNRQIGVLSGLAWAALVNEKSRAVAECLDIVIAALEGILKGDEKDG